MSSGRLFRSECFSAFRMCSFSVRQRLHRLDSLLYDCALLAIDQLMVNGFLFLFNCQMCLDSSVLFWCFSCITRETLSNNNPCPSSPSSTIYIYIYRRRRTRWTWIVVTQSLKRYAIVRQLV